MKWAKEQAEFIPDGLVNQAISLWYDERPDRENRHASPSTLTECPRVIWLRKQGFPTNELGWGKRQRFMLGRVIENTIAEQLKNAGKLLWAWPDDYVGQSRKFEHGEGLEYLAGTPDLLIRLNGKTAISDAKTGRSDGYGYISTNIKTVFNDPYWHKYKIQLNAYYMLCHWNKPWFTQRQLPLPDLCHLFSYALDDGIVRREFYWKPTKEDAIEVLRYTRRWNEAYASETIPDCTCVAEDKVKFCPYAYEFELTKKGSKLGVKCCADLTEEKEESSDNL